MIKFKVKKQGVYLAVKGEQVEQEVGTVLALDGDEVPAFLVGKGEVVGDSDGKELVAADELLESAVAENAELQKANKELADKLEHANAELQKVPAIVAELAEAKAENEALKKARGR